ncbi:hypothetical protein F4809DRAFT_638412 [Biscogniauxia mediterranea]|nr:hypothetical protein F4809DRAFT_638412 [Biscogniauxia mediterranea]
MAEQESHVGDSPMDDPYMTGTSISGSSTYDAPASDANTQDTSMTDKNGPDAWETCLEALISEKAGGMKASLKEFHEFRSAAHCFPLRPNRKRLLSPSLDPAERERVIIERTQAIESVWNVMVYHDYEYKQWSVEYLYDVLCKSGMSWNASPCCKDLQECLSKLAETSRIPAVAQVVCFGLGPILPDVALDKLSVAQANKHVRVVFQHAAALTIAKFFSKWLSREVPVIACDIAYQRQDIEALQRYGIAATKGSESGWPYVSIDKETFVFSIGCYPAVQQIVMETTRPAALLWSQPLAKHFRLDLSCIRHAWDPDWETHLMDESAILGDTEDMTPEWFTEMVAETGQPKGRLRRARRLAPATFWVRRPEYDEDVDDLTGDPFESVPMDVNQGISGEIPWMEVIQEETVVEEEAT